MASHSSITARLSHLGLGLPELLVPSSGVDLSRWAVVACDQYTSDLAYWQRVDQKVAEAPSALRLILPEVYLESPDVAQRISEIHRCMGEYLRSGVLTSAGNGFVFVRRSTAHSGVREGLVVAVDLERYDYARDSKSLFRATEGTIVDRIPPRLAVRRAAPLELPHIMILLDDPKREILEGLGERVGELPQAYDIELMEQGGRLQGWFLRGGPQLDELVGQLEVLLANTMASQGTSTPLLWAMGDGNHSLATAKARWAELKAELLAAGTPEAEVLSHPSRWALAELVNVHSTGLLFEPIHRAVFTVDVAGLTAALRADPAVASLEAVEEQALQQLLASPLGQDKAGYYDGSQFYQVNYRPEIRELPTALVDSLHARFRLVEPTARIDFIHGWEDTRKLSCEGAGCFFTPVIARERLFSWVQQNGPLPRKSFSMGHAEEKRFYLESRRIS
jgi:hypothetical protein